MLKASPFNFFSMKKLILAISILICTIQVFSQSNNYKYFELTASVDILGNIKMIPITGKSKNIQDTSINYKLINSIIAKSKDAITTINLLSEEGWYLILSKMTTGDLIRLI